MVKLNSRILHLFLISFFLFNFVISVGSSQLGIPKSSEIQTSISFIFLYCMPIYLAFFFSQKDEKNKWIYRSIGSILTVQCIIVVVNRWEPLDWATPFMFSVVVGCIVVYIFSFAIEKAKSYVWKKIKQ